MRHSVAFATSDGRSWDLSSVRLASGTLWDTGLMAWEWDADDDTGSLARDPATFRVTALLPDPATANALCLATYEDASAGSAGTLTVDGWALSCVVSAGTPEAEPGGRCRVALDLYAFDPLWRRVTMHHLRPRSDEGRVGDVDPGPGAVAWGEDVPATGLDLPADHPWDWANAPRRSQLVAGCDYPHDYGWDLAGSLLAVDRAAEFDVGTAFSVRCTFFGAATSPYATVTSTPASGAATTNRYGVSAVAAEGERVVVDPLGRRVVGGSVYRVGSYGQRTNLFDARLRGTEGSGTYVFQRLPAGHVVVTWPGTYPLDVETIEERGSLPWT